MYPGMVLCTRALPVSASMYVSTHFRQRVEEEEEGDEEEDEDEDEEEDGGRGRRRRRGGRGRGGGGGGGEQLHSEQRLHAYTTVTPPHKGAPMWPYDGGHRLHQLHRSHEYGG